MKKEIPALTLRGLTKHYPGKVLFTDLDLTLAPGVHYRLVGKSGCGKTTLLRILAGLCKPDHGTVKGIDPTRDLAVVFQEPRLFPTLTVLQNLLAVFPKPGDGERKEALALLQALELSDSADQLPEELSGGMAQRVAIGRALLADRPILLLDEPFKGLDPKTRERVLALVARKSAGKTLLLVTHDAAEAEALGCEALSLFSEK